MAATVADKSSSRQGPRPPATSSLDVKIRCASFVRVADAVRAPGAAGGRAHSPPMERAPRYVADLRGFALLPKAVARYLAAVPQQWCLTYALRESLLVDFAVLLDARRRLARISSIGTSFRPTATIGIARGRFA